MADKHLKNPDNVNGKYYVDEQCIVCDACVNAAPKNFKINDEKGYSQVIKQPENEEEEQACLEAKEGCPVEAIGNDGDED